MSIEAVNQFLTEVSESKELQAEVTTVKETEMEAENYWQAFTEIAAKHGYEFTPDELASQIEQAFEASNAENLNEAELELIAGGSLARTIAKGLGVAGVVGAGLGFTLIGLPAIIGAAHRK